MNMIDQLLSGPGIEALGWTLLHSIWQGALVAIMLAITMILLRKGVAKTRYFISFTALVLMLGLSVVTFFRVYDPVSPTGQIVNGYISSDHAAFMIPGDQFASEDQSSRIDRLRQSFSAYFERNMPLLVTIWLMGIGFFFLKFLGGYAYTQRLKHYRTLEVTEYWRHKVHILSHRIGLYKPVRMLESALVRVPMVVGFIKPVILVPLGMLSSVPPQQIEAIITHELAHIYRRDYLFNLFQSLIDILFFYHPAVWWISRNIRMEREHICDDLVIMVNHDSIAYAKALASVQEMTFACPSPATALAGKKYQLLNRINRVMNKPRIIPSFAEGFMSALIILAGIIGMSATAAISFGTEDLPVFGKNLDQPATKVTAPAVVAEDPPEWAAVMQEPAHVKEVITKLPILLPDTISDAKRDSLALVIKHEMQKAMQELSASIEARERALEAYREALNARRYAEQKVREKIREQYMEHMEDYMKQIQEYIEQLEETYPDDSLREQLFLWDGHFGVLPGDFTFDWRSPSEEWEEEDFDFNWYCDSGSFYFYSPWVPLPDDRWLGIKKYQYFDDDQLELIEGDQLELLKEDQLEAIQEYQEQLEELESLRDNLEPLEPEELDIDELLERPENYSYYHYKPNKYHYQYNYQYPYKYHYSYSYSKTKSIITDELRDDGLIGRDGDYIIVIDSSGMYINGDKQDKEIYKKYKRLFETLEDEKITSDNSFKLVL